MSAARFGTVITAMVTPFDDDLRLDVDVAATVARWLVGHGSDGLVVAGTTGEGPTLSDGEKLDLFRAVRDAVDVPVIAGASTYDTAHSVHLTKEAVRVGVDGVLAVVPYYNKPSQANLVHHFNAIADAAGDTPVILYDVPHRPGGIGGGVVSVSAHWAGVQIGEMIAAFQKGDHDLARRLNEKLLPTYAFNSFDAAPSPAPTKAMLRTLGLPVGRPRPPMGPDEPADLEARARRVHAALG